MITHKSDIWSGCVTMMNVLIGKGANIESRTQVHAYYIYTYNIKYNHLYVDQ